MTKRRHCANNQQFEPALKPVRVSVVTVTPVGCDWRPAAVIHGLIIRLAGWVLLLGYGPKSQHSTAHWHEAVRRGTRFCTPKQDPVVTYRTVPVRVDGTRTQFEIGTHRMPVKWSHFERKRYAHFFTGARYIPHSVYKIPIKHLSCPSHTLYISAVGRRFVTTGDVPWQPECGPVTAVFANWAPNDTVSTTAWRRLHSKQCDRRKSIAKLTSYQ